MTNDPDQAKTSPAQPGFGGFLQRYGRLLAALLAVSSSPLLTSLVVRIGPPWPEEAGTSALVCIVNVVLLMFIYLNTATARPASSKRVVNLLAITFVTTLVMYVGLKSFCCYDAPDWQHQVAGGFVLRSEIKDLMATEHNMSVKELEVLSIVVDEEFVRRRPLSWSHPRTPFP